MLSRRIVLMVPLLFGLLMLTAQVAQADEKKDEKKTDEKAVLAHIKLAGNFEETPTTADPLLGIQPENFKFKLERIKKAAKDSTVKGLFLHIDGLDIGWGRMNEMRRAIQQCRAAGKKVYAYLEEGSTVEYLVAAACDEVVIPEAGWLMMAGMRGEVLFFKDLLDWLNIKAEMMQMGDYKAAAEPFTRNSMSKAFRENMDSILDDHFAALCATIAESRKEKGYTAEKVKELIDEGPFTARAALKHGLVDRLDYLDSYRKSVEERVKNGAKVEKLTFEKDYGKDKGKKEPSIVDILKILAGPTETKLSKNPKIAVIYAVGMIDTGKGGQSLFGESVVGSTTMVEAIRKAENEPTVKAIVLRVDSPGGSALASDLIWNELKQCKKPVIASMGDVAGSGGYYICMSSRRIFAEPGTLTGSIGVIGGKLVLGGLLDKVGIKVEVLSRGKNAGMLSPMTPFTESERKAWRGMMEDVYDQFLTKAFEGRKGAGNDKIASRGELEKLAGGRVYTGRQALANGLIDELGTLDDALAYAKGQAGFKKDEEPELYVLPKPRSFLDSLLETIGDVQTPEVKGVKLPLIELMPELAGHVRAAAGLIHLRDEPVWAVMPHRIVVK